MIVCLNFKGVKEELEDVVPPDNRPFGLPCAIAVSLLHGETPK